MAAVLNPDSAGRRRSFYDRINVGNCAPLWEVLHSLISAQPQTPCTPYLWKWEQVWPWIREAGDLITFLASGRGGFINGASINFDGGVAPVV